MNANKMSGIETALRDPISQYVMAGSFDVGSATNFTSEISEVKKDPMMIPDRTRTSIDSPLYICESSIANPTDNNPKKKAEPSIRRSGRENSIATAAPNPAPEDTPRMSGETMGFRKRL